MPTLILNVLSTLQLKTRLASSSEKEERSVAPLLTETFICLQ